MSDYVLETGIALMVAWFWLCLMGLIAAGLWIGVWPLLILVPPMVFIIPVWKLKLWDRRPSLKH